jgi:salicylate hydroxylase
MDEGLVIAGAGMGGLSASIALGLSGQKSLLFERSPVITEIGAGIQLGPNASRILESWGMLRALMQQAACPTHLEVFNGNQPHALAKLELGAHFKRRYAAPYLTLHRADLQACLLQRLNAIGQTDLQMGRTLVGVNARRDGVEVQWGVTEHLEDATLFQDQDQARAQSPFQQHSSTGPDHSVSHLPSSNDLNTRAKALIGADGIASQVRRLCWPGRPLQATPHWAYRTLIEQKSLPLKLRQNSVRVYLGPHMHWVQYPVRAGEWLNIVALIEVPKLSSSRQGLDADPLYPTWQEHMPLEQTQAHWRSALVGAHPEMLELYHAVNAHRGGGAWSAWRLFDAEPLRGPQEMARGPLALLGDAAHPMLPFLAQGAGMSVEDAQSLANCWSVHDKTVDERLLAYAQERWQRNARVQSRARTNAQIFHARGWVAKARDWSLRVGGQNLLDMPWLYGHGSSVESQ